MYFDLEPKSNRKDLYNFENQLSKLLDLLRERRARAPLLVVKGLRRTGKTSIVRTALGESGLPHLIVDGRRFATAATIKRGDLFDSIGRDLNHSLEENQKWRDKLLDLLGGVVWLRVNSKPPWVHFEWKKPREPDLMDLLHSFHSFARRNRTKFVLVLDEAQEFRKLVGYRLQPLMAHVYDYVDGIQMIVTGSQVGLLNDFLQVDDPDAPLFGRGWAEIEMTRISDQAAEDFLKKGFEQAGIEPDPGVVRLAVGKLDGVIGWLTLFGFRALESKPTKRILDGVVREGSELAFQELEHFLATRKQASGRYSKILRGAGQLGRARWSELKRQLELAENKRVPDNVFSDLLNELVKANLLERDEYGAYIVADPLLAHAFKQR